MEDQIGALGLVLNALVLFNTRYMDAAITQLRADGFDVRDEDVARLSPFLRHHINMLGRYSFQLPDLPGGLRSGSWMPSMRNSFVNPSSWSRLGRPCSSATRSQYRKAEVPPRQLADRLSHWSRRCALVTASTAVVSAHTA